MDIDMDIVIDMGILHSGTRRRDSGNHVLQDPYVHAMWPLMKAVPQSTHEGPSK